MSPNARPDEQSWRFDAALATWFLPGVGHLFLGEARRGAILGITIMILWVTGFLIGGVSVFDRHDHTIMFWLGQDCFAGNVVGDQALQRLFRQDGRDPLPSPNASFEPSFNRVNEQGVLYTTIAGMLNLLAMLDVVYRDPHRRRSDNPNVGTTLDLAAGRSAGAAPGAGAGSPS